MINVQKTIGVWGDSILKGVIFDEIRGTYQLLADNGASLISKKLGLNILNKSKFGCTIDKGRQILEKSLESGLDCDYVLLEYGGNDCDFDWKAVSSDPDLPHQPHTTLSQFKKQLQDMIDLLRKNHIEPVLMSLPPISGEGYLNFLVSKGLDRKSLLKFLGDTQQIYRFHESYSLAATGIALINRCIYIPVRETFLAVHNSQSLLCSDGIHPNEKGHQLMQQAFTETVIAQRLSLA
ncbi:MAG: SGNH/GDSL hydrolase family protein [Saccharofermentanales bacterium]